MPDTPPFAANARPPLSEEAETTLLATLDWRKRQADHYRAALQKIVDRYREPDGATAEEDMYDIATQALAYGP